MQPKVDCWDRGKNTIIVDSLSKIGAQS